MTGNADFGAVKLTSISAYNKLIRREYADWDATQFDDSDEYLNSDLNVFSQELRLSASSGRFDWVAESSTPMKICARIFTPILPTALEALR